MINLTASCVIDFAMIEKLRGMQSDAAPTLVKDVIELFLTLAPTSISILKSARASVDLAKLHSEAHSFKSSCANLGAVRLEEIANRVEKSNDWEMIDDLIELLEREYPQVEAALRGYNAH